MVTQANPFRSTRTAGFWLAAAIAALQGLNAVRTVLDPQGFATYMGLPVDQLSALGWVQVYGLRAGFIAVLTAVLLARSDFAALRWMALAALLMPLGDAYLAFSAGAGAPIVGRHLAIAVFLLVAALFLGRAAKAREMQP
ncbi:DUF4267 domain-containing protein [Sphingosinicella microcystinivorans]|uniref:Uncharacterized protein DUF4267 n=1 Tax=Sphingosinicella microcystinivorans TaxID=335406 RepID=A0ABX9SZC0_SPHMI|nr:DUF4267 domain-containing protein [Sphingosinicella microcystinivorans]RKS89264.1 uncharacterized protein DUF4267 [Sphingosinicella microcystinivorans]